MANGPQDEEMDTIKTNLLFCMHGDHKQTFGKTMSLMISLYNIKKVLAQKINHLFIGKMDTFMKN